MSEPKKRGRKKGGRNAHHVIPRVAFPSRIAPATLTIILSDRRGKESAGRVVERWAEERKTDKE